MIALSYSFLTRLARLLTRVILGSKFHLRGISNVPASGPILIVSNHVGAVDPAIIGAWTPRPVWFMAKAELFKGSWTWLMRGYHAFPVVRHSADRTALRRAFELLKQGSAVVLFPEGHRSETGRLLRAEPGAGFVARRSGAPLVPIAITGTQNVIGRHKVIPQRAEVVMTFGQAFTLPERNRDGNPMDHQQSSDYLMTKIAQLLPLENQGEYASSPMPKSAQA